MLMKKSKKMVLVIILVILGQMFPITSSLAIEKGEAGNTGEIEFYLEETPGLKSKPKETPKQSIRLPQTGNQSSLLLISLGVGVLLVVIRIAYKRRAAHE